MHSLSTIRGIGIAVEDRLCRAGIKSCDQLVDTSPSEIREILGYLAQGADIERWIEQAQELFASMRFERFPKYTLPTVSTPSPMIDLLRRVSLVLHCVAWFGLAGLVLPHTATAGEGHDSTNDKPSAIAVFGGIMTDNKWEDAVAPWNLDFRDSTFVGLAASHVIGRFDHRLGFEIEGQVIRHFGDQDHWEFNLPIIGRWEAFPWDKVVDTSLAFGIGPSYASEKPKIEVANEGDSQRWLVYWMVEIEAGPPDKDWSVIFRLHHRSEAFGLIADEGGSNAMVIGLKQRF